MQADVSRTTQPAQPQSDATASILELSTIMRQSPRLIRTVPITRHPIRRLHTGSSAESTEPDSRRSDPAIAARSRAQFTA